MPKWAIEIDAWTTYADRMVRDIEAETKEDAIDILLTTMSDEGDYDDIEIVDVTKKEGE